jgi:protein involved in polysaccharide export with SLBB domain
MALRHIPITVDIPIGVGYRCTMPAVWQKKCMKAGTIIFKVAILLVSIMGLSVCAIGADNTGTESGEKQYFYQSYTFPLVPDLYLIRPGEHIAITFLGTRLSPLELVVGQEGKLVHPALGVFDLSGKTLTEARKLLEGPLKAQYNADQIDISVGVPYRVTVSVTGAVNQPGNYQAYTSQGVSDMITAAGGVKPDGSMRTIEFSSQNVTHTVDLERALYGGDPMSDLRLYAGYRIFVPNRSTKVVQVVGQVNNPREIELLPDDSLDLLVTLAGGATTDADPSGIHILGDPDRNPRIAGNIRPGDVIVVPAHTDTPSLIVVGEVVKPGRCTFRDSMTLADVLAEAGGPTARANTERTTVFRRAEPDEWGHTAKTRYPIRSSSAKDGSTDKTVMFPSDSVIVPLKLGYVKVSGMVRNPGLFPYTPKKPASYYIETAGGFSTQAARQEIRLFDRISRTTVLVSPDAIPSDGDEINVTAIENAR